MKTIFTILFALIIGTAIAQPDTDPIDQEEYGIEDTNYDWAWKQHIVSAPPPPPTPVPIDGGISFLLLAGAGYGARRLMKKS